jgi:hypothetical protein
VEFGVSIDMSFWDIQTSDQNTSTGGEGKSTAEMQTATTFLDAGWDFVGETANGTEDIWWIDVKIIPHWCQRYTIYINISSHDKTFIPV